MKNFLALLVFAGGIAGWYLYHQKQEVTESLEAAQRQLAELEKVAGTRRAETQVMNGAMAVSQKIAGKQAELKELRGKLTTVQEAQAVVMRKRQQMLVAIRQTFVGKTMPLTLTTGRNLGSVRIVKSDDTGLTVAMTSGVLKVPPQELPQDLKTMLNY